ncbi:MAG: ABC transporter substrate-binding protein, partial [Dehalococcoidia bacterium]
MGGASSTGQPATGTAAPAPKPGGIYRTLQDEDLASFDPLEARTAITNTIAGFAYSRLLKFKMGEGRLADGTLEADAVTKWEQPDETTILLRLRDSMKFEQRSPTNGRTLTTEDVVLSWEKFAASAAYRGDLAQSANPSAPITSFQASDANQIMIKTAYPDAQLLPSMNFWGGLWILPKEGLTGGFEPATTMRGSGPWILEQHQASVGFSFKKNPNYYGVPGQPLLDGVEVPIITDAAQASAQFKAKNLHGGSPSAVPTTDIVAFYRDLKGTRIDMEAPPVGGPTISFSWRENNPYRDKRVRQAMSMLIDRDAYIDLFYDLKNFQSADVEMRAYWNTPLSAGWGPFWLDPKSDAFGSNGKYLKRDVGEAKKLLAAAGYADGFETPFTYVAGSNYGRDWGQRAEALMAMLGEGGIRCQANAIDYRSVWIPSYLRNHGDFDGMAMYPNGSRGD